MLRKRLEERAFQIARSGRVDDLLRDSYFNPQRLQIDDSRRKALEELMKRYVMQYDAVYAELTPAVQAAFKRAQESGAIDTKWVPKGPTDPAPPLPPGTHPDAVPVLFYGPEGAYRVIVTPEDCPQLSPLKLQMLELKAALHDEILAVLSGTQATASER